MSPEGHVLTGNLEDMPWELRDVFEYGANFRYQLKAEDTLEAIELGLECYTRPKLEYWITRNENGSNQPQIDKLKAWKEYVIDQCKSQIRASDETKQQQRLTKKKLDAIKKLRKDFVICRVDKTTHNLCVMCKELYKWKLSKELRSEEIYTDAGEEEGNGLLTSEADILERHKAFMQEQGYKKFVPKLPYAYLTVKCHKDPIGSRFIVGVAADQRARNDGEELSIVEKLHFATTKSPECSTTAASVWLDKELKKVMTLLEAKDKRLIAEQGISRYWIIEDMERFFQDVKIKDAMGQLKGKKPRTTDFTTMYTSLQQDDIVNNVGKAVEEALSFNERCSDRDHIRDIATKTKIMKHVKFIVQNTYIGNDPTYIVRQTRGLPMGTNCAPRLANLTLYVYEAKYIDRLLHQGKIEDARLHTNTKRFIDDMISFGTEPPGSEWYAGLEHKETTKATCVEFLGAKIEWKPDGYLDFWVFDKFDEWNFSVIKFPHADSNAAEHQSPGIVTGQLNRFRSIINSVKAFKEATTKLVIQMLRRKHSTIQIYKGWEQHVKKYQGDGYMNYSILRAWFRRMINWAYKNNQHSEAIAYAEQRHRIQLDVAYSPVSPVVQQLSDQATLGHQQDNEDQGTPSSIETNDTVQQDHVEIVSINSTPDEDRSHEIISINSTPEQPINSADDNSVENNFLRAFNLSFGRLGQQQPQNQLQEQQRRRSSRQRTPRTSLTASSFSNSRQSYEIRVSKGKNKR